MLTDLVTKRHLLFLTAVTKSSTAKSRRPVRGRKIVITTGRLARHDAGTSSGGRSTVSAGHGRQGAGQSISARQTGRQSQRRHRHQQQPASSNMACDDDDEWEVDDAGKTPPHSCTADRPIAPCHPMEHGIADEEINSG